MITITIFTPSYNRADLLPRLYDSLCNQTCKDFEWLIVDDGSRDDTVAVVQRFVDEGKLSVRYFKKENGGKHTAINMGAQLANGELLFIADSDDYLPSKAVAWVKEQWESVKDRPDAFKFGGVCGLDGYEDGRIVGSGLPKAIIDASYTDIRSRYGVCGDMKEVYLTSVMCEFPFPEIKGERFCPEALIWNRIATKYQLRYFNRVIYTAEYQENGITSGITRARMNSPIAIMMTYSEWFDLNIPIKQKVRMAINYWRFAFCTENRTVKIASWGKLLAPIGYIMHLRDNRYQ